MNKKNFKPLCFSGRTTLNKKMKTIKRTLFSFCLCVSLVSQAQITPKVMQRFPAYIIYKIDEVASKIKLTEDQQIQIGNQLTIKDSIANVLKRKDGAVINLKSYYTINKETLKSILSQKELEDYLSQVDKKNRFLLALKSAKELQLDAKQIELIRIQNDLSATMPNDNTKKRMIFYTQKLDSILNNLQYGYLIKIIYNKQTLAQSRKDWNNILKLKLATLKDSSAIYPQILQYHSIKNSVLDEKSGIRNNKEIKQLNNEINLQYQPKIITWCNILRDGSYEKNIFSETIKYQKELNLTAIQIDTLLVNYRKIEQLKFKNKEENQVLDKSKTYVSIENKKIVKILDSKQLTLLLVKKNEKLAMQKAINDWNTIEKQGLTKDLNKEDTIKELANYQLKYLVADNRVKMDKNQINVFHRRDLLLNKPALLKQLDQSKQNEQNIKSTKNELKW